jgi:hypothetical protein
MCERYRSSSERSDCAQSYLPATVLYAQRVHGNGRELFAEVCRQDLESIVA